MNAWTPPAVRTPGHDAQTATLLDAQNQQAETFNDRVITRITRLNTEAAATRPNTPRSNP